MTPSISGRFYFAQEALTPAYATSPWVEGVIPSRSFSPSFIPPSKSARLAYFAVDLVLFRSENVKSLEHTCKQPCFLSLDFLFRTSIPGNVRSKASQKPGRRSDYCRPLR
ncbi:hypothetical protein PM082_004995 [Marasmius tenuissimus]|nr:hypothetical protein PM082_004995 [Marasmius tenuissimus]